MWPTICYLKSVAAKGTLRKTYLTLCCQHWVCWCCVTNVGPGQLIPPGKCSSSFKSVISAHVLRIQSMGTSCALWRMPTNTHDDVIKWKHFPCYWSFVWGIYRSPVGSPNKLQWRGRALIFSLVSAWTNGGANNRNAGDLRCHLAHYDVTEMFCWQVSIASGNG